MERAMQIFAILFVCACVVVVGLGFPLCHLEYLFLCVVSYFFKKELAWSFMLSWNPNLPLIVENLTNL